MRRGRLLASSLRVLTAVSPATMPTPPISRGERPSGKYLSRDPNTRASWLKVRTRVSSENNGKAMPQLGFIRFRFQIFAQLVHMYLTRRSLLHQFLQGKH